MKNLYPKRLMSFVLIIILSFGMWPVPARAAGPTVVTLGASGDTWIDQKNPLSNNGDKFDIKLHSKANENTRGLISFDLSSVPSNAIISSAVLSLYLKNDSSNDRTIEAHRTTAVWSESTANWSNQPTFDSAVSGSVFTGDTTADKWVDFTLTSDVSAMVAGTYSSYGWVLKDSVEGSTSGRETNFRSKNYSQSEFRPKLTITYTLPPTGAVSGTVFEDSDGNGSKNGSETGLSGWEVTLSGTGDVSDVVQTTTTGADGAYSFSALPDGTYHICQSVKSETPTWSATKNSGYDCGGIFGYEVTLSGGAESGYDFGNLQYGSVTIVVVTEPSSSAETFSVYLDSVASPAPLSNGGSYTFASVVPGTHAATEDLPVDWVASSVCSDGSPISAINVGKGEDVTCTFTNTQKGKMIVQKKTLPSEDPTEFAFTGDLSTAELNEGVGLSDGETMELVALPGEYTSVEVPVAGWDLTEISCDSANGVGSIADSSATFNLSAGETIHCVFTNTKRATLEIVNIVDPNEGVFGYTITGPSSIGPASFVGNGSATYENILPGEYNISETLPDGFDGIESASCSIESGSVDPRSGSITLEPGSHVVCTYNHGAFGVINGKVFNDKNQNSQKDKGEGSLSGWTINLFADGETDPMKTQVTTKAGYEFKSLSPGVYNVCQVLKPLWHQTLPLTGVSCPDGTGYQLDLRAGEIKSNVDFGNYKNGTISGRVFSDLNANSVRNSGEPWLSGWEVKLMSEDGTTVIDTETTGSGGKYQFTDVTPGTYTMVETVQTGWVKTLPTSASYTVTVASNQTKKNINFGNYHDTVAPTVSVGFGNGNAPANTGPEHSSIHNGTVPVYVTVTDMFPSGFHLRVVKDGGNQGHSCGDSLSAPENQGYGGCGYVYNMVVSTTTSLTNYHLVDLSTANFGGDGDYWVILGAVDSSGNRTDSNYLNDPKVKITVDHAYNADQTAPDVPTLEFPADGAVVKPSVLILDWSSVTDPSSPVVYYYQSAYSGATTTDNALSSPIYSSGALSDSQIDGTGSADATYFWQVRACDSVGNCSAWSDPRQVTVDSVAPVSTITSPNPNSVIEDEFITITGTTTDANGVASTTLAFATYIPEGEGSCGEYSFITSLINSPVSNQFDWTYDWTPEEDGIFCLTSHGQDMAGNEEASPFVMNVQFKKVSKTVTPPATTETTSTQTGGGSSAPAGNGPIVGFTLPQASAPSGGSPGNGSPIALNPETSETFPPTNQPAGQGQNQNNGNVGNPGGGVPETPAGGGLVAPEEAITPTEDEALSSDQVAASVLSGDWLTWENILWFILLLILIALIVFFWRRRDKKSSIQKTGGMY